MVLLVPADGYCHFLPGRELEAPPHLPRKDLFPTLNGIRCSNDVDAGALGEAATAGWVLLESGFDHSGIPVYATTHCPQLKAVLGAAK